MKLAFNDLPLMRINSTETKMSPDKTSIKILLISSEYSKEIDVSHINHDRMKFLIFAKARAMITIVNTNGCMTIYFVTWDMSVFRKMTLKTHDLH